MDVYLLEIELRGFVEIHADFGNVEAQGYGDFSGFCVDIGRGII